MTRPSRPTVHSDEAILATARLLQQEARLSRAALKLALEDLAERAGQGRISADTARLAAVISTVRAEARAGTSGAATPGAPATPEGASAELPASIRVALEQLVGACRRELDALRAEEEGRARLMLQAERRETEARRVRLEADLALASEEALADAADADAVRAALADSATRLADAERAVATLTRDLAHERAARARRESEADEERRQFAARLDAATTGASAAEDARRGVEIDRERVRGAYEAERAMRERLESECTRRERDVADFQLRLAGLVGELAEARASLAHRPTPDAAAVALALRDLLAEGSAVTASRAGESDSGYGPPPTFTGR